MKSFSPIGRKYLSVACTSFHRVLSSKSCGIEEAELNGICATWKPLYYLQDGTLQFIETVDYLQVLI